MTTTDRPNRFHLSLNVRPERLEDMAQFYGALFGTTPAKRKPGYIKFDLAEPALNFTLNAAGEVQTSEISHLGIQVFTEEALRAARARIQAAGLPIREEPEVDCCYATQNKFWVTDPDGRQVEFFHTLRDIEEHGRKPVAQESAAQKESAPAACCAPTCCAPATSAP